MHDVQMCMYTYVCMEGQLALGILCLLRFWITDRPQCLFNICVGSGYLNFGTQSLYNKHFMHLLHSLHYTLNAERQEQPTQPDLQGAKHGISLEAAI